MSTLARHPSVHRYGAIEGRSELLESLSNKIKTQNNLNKSVYVTSGTFATTNSAHHLGCNQAYFHVVMATCDPGDEVVLIAPYYFNHYMALQLLNLNPIVIHDFVGKLAHNNNVRFFKFPFNLID